MVRQLDKVSLNEAPLEADDHAAAQFVRWASRAHTLLAAHFFCFINEELRMKIRRAGSVILSITIGLSNLAYARPEIDKMSICYGVKGDKQSFKEPCIVTNGGGAGISILIYKIKSKEYTIEKSDDGDFLNGRKYTTYMRDSFFLKTKSEDDKSYFCYKTFDKKIEFCSSQPQE